MEHEQLLVLGVAGIVVLGVAAQWFAARIGLPSILLLLVTGFLVGPVAGWIRPTELFGETLPVLVGLAVAVVLFDGGLRLRFAEVREVQRVVRLLITLGAAITLLVGTVAGRLLLELPWRMALLLSAILVVSGPTVILPLLRHIRPKGRAGSVLKWEGIFIDPIGAVFAVLVFEVVVGRAARGEFGVAVLGGMFATAIVGIVLGGVAAAVLIGVLRRFLVPHHLEVPVTLMVVVAAYVGPNLVQPEAGLLSVTVLGVILANQPWVPVRHIAEFGETLGILLTSVLFVVLAADLRLDSFRAIGWPLVAYLGVLLVVARPLAVWASTIRSGMTRAERLLVSAIAPRGIVAASVATVFAARLGDLAGADLLVPYVFTVIAGAALVSGTLGPLLGRVLGLADRHPQGVIVLGAHLWARAIAQSLDAAGVTVLLVPSNRHDLRDARLEGLRVHPGSVLAAEALEHLDLDGIGRLVALTPNEEFNALAAVRFQERLGREHVYQLPADREPGTRREVTHDLRGRLLFGDDVTFHVLDERFRSGATVKRTKLSDEYGLADWRAQHEERLIPLFVLRNGGLEVVTPEGPEPRAGDEVIAVVGGESGADQPEEQGLDELTSPSAG